MVIVKTRNVKRTPPTNCLKENIYTCPHCSHEIIFEAYIPFSCGKCNKKVFNIEKLLNDSSDVRKVDYYTDERI